ncbi:MAG: coenzyme A pyrophosphatase, partial [Burkholderiaceae bacterium]|nr:coenzyme A pyrophosphatase [Burkholderiaceae bacterium]
MATVPFDPRQLAIDAIAGEAAVAAERLHPEWLRRRFAERCHPRDMGEISLRSLQLPFGLLSLCNVVVRLHHKPTTVRLTQ